MQELDGGFNRIRTDVLDPWATVDVQWTLNREDFNALATFYYDTINQGADLFELMLYIDSHIPTLHQCRIEDTTFQIVSQQGNSYTVRARLEVNPEVHVP